jgi:glycerophosphoryl diester phosphodiesterase
MGRARKELRWLTGRPIAHRGLHDAARGRPENSLAAFAAAEHANYAIECDVHPAADGVPVVFHDDDLDRLTGETGCIRDRESKDLGRLHLAGTREWIPTLDELLANVDGRVPLFIELKTMHGRDGGFAGAVASRLMRYPGPAALMSFDPSLLAEIRIAEPGLPRGLVAEGDWRAGREHLRTVRSLELDFVSYSIDDLPNLATIAMRRIFGIPLICWTVRTPEQAAKAATAADQITFEGFTP